ncbi:NAD(P)H-dependent oxidoreductase [Bradyrhizobium sp. Arg68]|uniref:FMN-dependent NADH-azoreductase n=1 Tax=Bradyrhizobium ivorense TaxID=2511166 RepID=UPI001E2FA5FF|nr:NAD(P)H-dependent oxidoreductase [Bradyrhizobium ivorense]MCC8941234.1 NAD(P)H-dependent oxidoreductase [Bradyrhizobium ivorense]
MTRILYVEASPRKNRSASIEVAHAALAAWSDLDPDLSVDVLDVWSTELPEFNGPIMAAKYAGLAGTPLTSEQAEAWAQISAIAARFLAADVILLAVPLWNFSIPYKLKQLIDVVSQKDVLFTFDGRAFDGLLGGRKALLVLARGLDYAPTGTTPAGTYDFQRPYLEMWLRYVGIADITTVVVEKTLMGPDVDSASRATAARAAIEAVRRLALPISA